MNTIYGRLGGASAVNTTYRELMQQALEALENVRHYDKENLYGLDEEITALRERLAQPDRGASCAECGKREADGWALYCVECMEG